MEMCPTCNEPAHSTEVRVDWTHERLRKPAACQGDAGDRTTGNVGSIEVFHGQPSPHGQSDATELAGPATATAESGGVQDLRDARVLVEPGPGGGAVEVRVPAGEVGAPEDGIGDRG